ncbi:MAG TPA: thymidine phosphorylase, partial [Candidatus Dormibacteraeota bacterium]|nr:thymidine phosphorylase [Candidatus Dormibacteraeota bacterium]
HMGHDYWSLTAIDVIRDKRDGRVLSDDAIEFVVRGATDGSIPDYQLAAWLMAVRLNGMTDAETKSLTLAMAASGRRLDLSSIPGRKVDKHSTGGVGDKATLVVAPLVAAAGIPVAKLSGRALGHSGGTLDKLESIPGFNVDLSIDDFIDQVRRIGIAIAGQTTDMVPADKVFYALRDATATVDSVPLIASSVMSKKLAAGADAIVLDVKCGRGAFVATLDEAEALARALVAIGTNAGRETVAYVTDMEQPLGRAVGNALEVREAIDTLGGQGPSDLEALSLRLGNEMLRMAGAETTDLRRLLSDGSALRKFAQLVEAQSGDPRVVDDPSRLPTAPIQRPVAAAASGQVAAIDALEIALVGKSLGAGRDRKDAAIDLAVGIVLQKKVGDAVQQGEPVATIHARTEQAAQQVATRVARAFRVAGSAQPRALLLRRISETGTERLDT